MTHCRQCDDKLKYHKENNFIKSHIISPLDIYWAVQILILLDIIILLKIVHCYSVSGKINDEIEKCETEYCIFLFSFISAKGTTFYEIAPTQNRRSKFLTYILNTTMCSLLYIHGKLAMLLLLTIYYFFCLQ